MPLSPTRAMHTLWDRVVSYALKFGVVGLIGLVIDVGLFNLLRFGPLGGETWVASALGRKTVSTSVAFGFTSPYFLAAEITLFVWAVATFPAAPALPVGVVHFGQDSPHPVSTIHLRASNTGPAPRATAGGPAIPPT